MLAEAGNLIDLSVGLLEALVAFTLAANLRRARFSLPLLAVLATFFALRSSDRLATGLIGESSRSLRLIVDVCAAAVLLALLFTASRIFSALELRWDTARRREREYERALVDYRRLARHRVANPVTAIVGSARALHDLPDLDQNTRTKLLDVILSESERLGRVELEPGTPLALEERKLRPAPQPEAREPANADLFPFARKAEGARK
jgi:signal transduction histidine kinase